MTSHVSSTLEKNELFQPRLSTILIRSLSYLKGWLGEFHHSLSSKGTKEVNLMDTETLISPHPFKIHKILV